MGSTKPPNMAKTPRPEKRSREEDTSGLDTQSRPAKYRRTERLQESNNSNTTGHPKPNNGTVLPFGPLYWEVRLIFY